MRKINYTINLLIHTIVKICVIAVHEVSAARELINRGKESTIHCKKEF